MRVAFGLAQLAVIIQWTSSTSRTHTGEWRKAVRCVSGRWSNSARVTITAANGINWTEVHGSSEIWLALCAAESAKLTRVGLRSNVQFAHNLKDNQSSHSRFRTHMLSIPCPPTYCTIHICIPHRQIHTRTFPNRCAKQQANRNRTYETYSYRCHQTNLR